MGFVERGGAAAGSVRYDRSQLIAAGLILLSALCFSAKAVMIKLYYRYEVDSISLLALRMLWALPFFLFVIWRTRSKGEPALRTRFGDLVPVFMFGLLGYYFASLYDFMGLQYVTASLERLILFLYPTIVLLISAVLFGKKISRAQVVALFMTYAGIALAFLDGRQVLQGSNIAYGGFLIFLSAMTYALYMEGASMLLPRYGSKRYTALAVSAGCVAILIHHGIAYRWALWHFRPEVYILCLLMALFSTVLPVFLVSEGIRRIGASNAAIISSIGPISTIVLGYWLLGESFGVWQLAGTLVVSAGVVYISLAKS